MRLSTNFIDFIIISVEKDVKTFFEKRYTFSVGRLSAEGGILMNHCTTCGAEFEGDFCPRCGRKAATVATASALRSKHALRLLHSLLLIAFGVLAIGLMAAGAFGDFVSVSSNELSETVQLTSITFFEILTMEGAAGDPLFVCTVFLLVFAILAVIYGVILALFNKRYSDLKYTTILFIYLPLFIIMCAFASHCRASQSITQEDFLAMGVTIPGLPSQFTVSFYTELIAGGISIFVLSVVFALTQIVILIMEARVEKTYIFEDKEAAVAAELGAPDSVPYPEIPQINDFSKESQKVYYAARNVFYERVDLHNANRKEWRAFQKTLITTLYQRHFGKPASYPLAYLWWNFSA